MPQPQSFGQPPLRYQMTINHEEKLDWVSGSRLSRTSTSFKRFERPITRSSHQCLGGAYDGGEGLKTTEKLHGGGGTFG